MPLAKLPSAAVEGIDAVAVRVEVDVAQGLPGLTVVGLADRAVEESRERVRSAIKHTGFQFPLARLTVNLAPSEKKKTGIHFDLPIALGILLGDNQLKSSPKLDKTLFIGGLSLDGQLQAVTGTLILVEWAKTHGFEAVVLPISNYAEAKLVRGIELVPVETFHQAVDWLAGNFRARLPDLSHQPASDDIATDWLQIQGQEQAKRAALISASGGHNLLLEGSPGAGKTLLARGLRAILPELSQEELIEVAKLSSVAGLLNSNQALAELGRPFRNPHHSASAVAVVGGGSQPKPGEISLAHRGILFLDEIPEFPRSVLEALRQPLEDGVINVSRIYQAIRYPAQFLLVATMNPCPCGWFGSNRKTCQCSPYQIAQYRKKMSGPILDRIDIYLSVPAVPLSALKRPEQNYDQLTTVRTRVKKAWDIQRMRNHGLLNAHLPVSLIKQVCNLTPSAERLLDQAAERFVITGRGYHKLLKVARTISDVELSKTIEAAHIAEALQYRFANRDHF